MEESNLSLGFVNFESPQWLVTQSVLERIAKGEGSTPSTLKELLESIQSTNWGGDLNISGIYYMLRQENLELCGGSKFLSETLPWVAQQALQLKEKGLPFNRSGTPRSYKISRLHGLSILSCLFLVSTRRPHMLFSPEVVNAPSLQCKFFSFVNYFCRMHKRSFETDLESQYLTFERKAVDPKTWQEWKDMSFPMKKVEVFKDGGIEDYPEPALRVDFANQFIGGGTLELGNVQEEIAFTVHPELIVSQLIFEPMLDNEAILMVGAERFTKHSGYGSSFTYHSEYLDQRNYDEQNRLDSYMVGIDALELMGRHKEQFQVELVVRELNKAYAGFEGANRKIVSGKWGCGIFEGDPELKSVVQWVAASRAGKDLVISSFGDQRLDLLSGLCEKYQGRDSSVLLSDLEKTLSEAKEGTLSRLLECV